MAIASGLWYRVLLLANETLISLSQLVLLMLRPFGSWLKVTTLVALGVSFRSTSVTSIPFVNLLSGRPVVDTQVQNRVSGHETRIERDEKVVRKGNGACIKRGDEAANLLPDVEEKIGKSVLFMFTMM